MMIKQDMTLEELREERDRLVLEAETATLRAEIDAYQASENHQTIMEAGELVGSRYGYLWDDPTRTELDQFDEYPYSVISDRLRGENAPIFSTEQELQKIRGIARFIADVDATSIAALESLTNYEVGTGFEYDVIPQDGHELIAEYTEKWLEEFKTRTVWRRIERELFQRSHRDGEPFLQLIDIGSGRCRARIVEPTCIVEPPNPQDFNAHLGQVDLDWSFGVATNPADHCQVFGYYVSWDGANNWDVLLPHEICHDKLNVDSGVKRGISDYYSVYQDIRRAAKVYRNSGEGAAIQAAIALIKKYGDQTSGSQVSALISNRTQGTTMATTSSEPTIKVERFRPGSVYNAKGMDVMHGPMGSPHGPAIIDVADAIKRHVGTRWTMPEYMISGDASNANFASTLVSESPFVKAREAGQTRFSEYTVDIMWKILDIAVRAGRFKDFGVMNLPELKELVEIEAKPPRLTVRNRIDDTHVSHILQQAKILSKKTWAQQEELDYENEQKLIKEEVPASGTPFQQPGPPGVPQGPAAPFPGRPDPQGRAQPSMGAPNMQREGIESRFAEAARLLKGQSVLEHVDPLAEHIEDNWAVLEGKRFSLVEEIGSK